MRMTCLPLTFLTFAALVGCQPAAPVTDLNANTVQRSGLAVTLKLDRRSFVAGQTVRVALAARNVTQARIPIDATSGTPVFVRLWRNAGLGWEVVRTYPQSALMIASPWTLPPGAVRTFELRLPVEPDWPTGELLRLTGELNGRPDAQAVLTISIQPRPKE